MYIPLDALLIAAFIYYIVWAIVSSRDDARRQERESLSNARMLKRANETGRIIGDPWEISS